MRITVTFQTDNAAFEDDAATEIYDLLVQAYRKVGDHQHAPESWEEKLRDSNGNTVGFIRGELEE